MKYSDRFRVIASSTQGKKHKLLNIPCQDSIATMVGDDHVFVALCDGAGSVTDSDKISQFCTQSLSDGFLNEPRAYFKLSDEDLIDKVVNCTQKEIQRKYGNLNADCTLLLFAQLNDQSIIIHVGDGIILGVNEKETVCLSRPTKGVYANETYFLSCNDISDHIEIIRNIPDTYDTIIMASDGIENNIYDLANDEGVGATQIMRTWIQTSPALLNMPRVMEEKVDADELLEKAINGVFAQVADDDISLTVIKRCA